jgi:hypothetical protein
MISQRKSEGRKANPRGAGNKDRQGQVRGGHCGCAQAHNSIGPGGDSAKRRGGCDGRNPGGFVSVLAAIPALLCS